ncbi:MAG: hypothetical protein GXP44_01650 [bacterium]|nr:hypothetical protein [bacterium]
METEKEEIKPPKRVYSPAERLARSEIDRLGELMIENRKLAQEYEESGDKERAEEYRKEENRFGLELEKAKAARDRLKNEAVTGEKTDEKEEEALEKTGEKEKTSEDKEGSEKSIQDFMQDLWKKDEKDEKIQNLWEKHAEEELEKELNRTPKEENKEESEQKVIEELNKMPEKEREKVGLGLRNLGFFVEEKKNRFFSLALETAFGKVEKKGTMGRFLSSLSETFGRDAERARKKMEETEKGDKKRLLNMGYLVGNTLKYGRVLADVVGYTVASPLRYVMASGMFFARGAEAAKEARLKNEEVIEKTRIFDIDEAAEEAWKIYEEAKGGRDDVSKEELNEAYKKNIPRDLMRRLKEKPVPGLASGILQKIIKKDIEMSVKRIDGKIKKIEEDASLSDSEKESQKEKIIGKYSKQLKNFDRIVSRYGTVDSLAMGAQYAETGAKAVVAGMMAETFALSVEKLLRSDLGSILGSLGGAEHHDTAATGAQNLKVDAAGHGGVEMAGSGADNPPLDHPGAEHPGGHFDFSKHFEDTQQRTNELLGSQDHIPPMAEIPKEITVKPGESVWKAAETWLKGNGKLDGLNKEQQTYVIDSLKDKLVKGMQNPDMIKPGEKIGFGNKFSLEDVNKAIHGAKGLTPEQMENIKNFQPAVAAPEDTPSFFAQEHLMDARRGEGGMNYPEPVGHEVHELAGGANHSEIPQTEIPQTEIPGELVSQSVDKYFNVPSWTYPEFSDMKMDDFMALKDGGFYDVSEPWSPPWVDYDHDEFSGLQEKITEVYKKLPLTERILEEKLPVEEFIKRNFEKIFPTGE